NAVNVGTAIRNLFGASRVQLNYSGFITDQLTSFDLQQRLNRFDLINSRSLGLGIFNNSVTGLGTTTGGTGVSVAGVGTGVGGLGGGIGVANSGGGGLGGFGGGGLGALGSLGFGGQGGGFGGVGGQRPGQLQQIVPPEKRLEGLTPDEIQELQDAL